LLKETVKIPIYFFTSETPSSQDLCKCEKQERKSFVCNAREPNDVKSIFLVRYLSNNLLFLTLSEKESHCGEVQNKNTEFFPLSLKKNLLRFGAYKNNINNTAL